MSDTPPNRNAEGDAMEGARNPWVSWIMWAVLAPVLYVLSVGPIVGLERRGYIPEWTLNVYAPLEELPRGQLLYILHYVDWWKP